MASRLEIMLKKGLTDAEGANVKKKARDYFGFEVEDARVIRILTIDAELDPRQLEAARTQIFTNPVTEASSYSPLTLDFDWAIWVGLRPGVRDTAGSTAVEAMEDLLKCTFKPRETVYTSKLYCLTGTLSEKQVVKIGLNMKDTQNFMYIQIHYSQHLTQP